MGESCFAFHDPWLARQKTGERLKQDDEESRIGWQGEQVLLARERSAQSRRIEGDWKGVVWWIHVLQYFQESY